jgi:mono/diheme cytochrome c family protein
MRLRVHAVVVAAFCWGPIGAIAAYAQDAGSRPAAASPGRDLVTGKCFQCHTDSMFRDGRMERVGWEAAIYRMIGRGGQYTTDEIKQMADYLGSEFGPSAKPAAPSR